MKKILLFFIASICAVNMFAQSNKTYQMRVYEKAGAIKTYICSDVDSITFTELSSSLSVPVTFVEGNPIGLTLNFNKPNACKKFYVYCTTEKQELAPIALVNIVKQYHQYEFTTGGEQVINNLVTNSNYYVYTLALDENGNVGSVESCEGKTTEMTGNWFTFTMEDLQQNSTQINVHPTINGMSYTCTLLNKAKYNEETARYDDGIYGFDKDWWQWVSEQDQTTWLETMKGSMFTEDCFINSKNHIRYMIWDTDYVVYAYGINNEGIKTTPIVTYDFKTLSPGTSNNQLKAEVVQTYKDGADIKITASNNDTYFLCSESLDYVDFYKGDNMAMFKNLLVSIDSPDRFLHNGSDTIRVNCRNKNKDYYLILVGYNGGPTTDFQIIKFHTAAE